VLFVRACAEYLCKNLFQKPPRLIRISGCRRYRLIVARDAARVRLIEKWLVLAGPDKGPNAPRTIGRLARRHPGCLKRPQAPRLS
jgi:hypothetical protein